MNDTELHTFDMSLGRDSTKLWSYKIWSTLLYVEPLKSWNVTSNKSLTVSYEVYWLLRSAVRRHAVPSMYHGITESLYRPPCEFRDHLSRTPLSSSSYTSKTNSDPSVCIKFSNCSFSSLTRHSPPHNTLSHISHGDHNTPVLNHTTITKLTGTDRQRCAHSDISFYDVISTFIAHSHALQLCS